MIEILKKHKYDDMALHQSTQSVAACDCHFEEKDGKQIKVIDVPILTCECVWRRYQKEAEDIVAPGGKLIADPKERNKRINAAYAKLWLNDNRFQWAGLAAFASKQVGCGLLHATNMLEKTQSEHNAIQRSADNAGKGKIKWSIPGLITVRENTDDEQTRKELEQAHKNNPIPLFDVRNREESLSLVQEQLNYVYEMMALGNTTLFLDVYPLHAFYKQRGLKDLKTCLPARKDIYANSQFSILWPIGQEKLEFGLSYKEILQTFEAIEADNIAKSVEYLAYHEQVNILQPSMYSDTHLVLLLRGNHLSYVIGFPSGATEAIELTLASQCRRVEDSRTIKFSNNPLADLSVVDQRMPFVLKAAKRFDEMLHDSNRSLLEKSLQDIAAGRGVE
ncbi:hypothetical protein ID852_18445 [Xenorhabdus sp. 42]|uniref:DUF2515 family protein n=1 Tax=Xenorhabdus szentirmaii TaxID=290112 RepID=UPI0019848392|nr:MULTISPECIES: hypothetical protein [unclassified Xenorhabdus]MBD2781647.1 hypothetical protein [Xenorhabdus sp. 38]MBD2793564.1 hypothetical protein [Xenorhabdus sp. CUL]MBD2822621.1 hypothetical protein [Xenorhabdus sp. 42]MBD2826294.1 hypothetical protein [Xenorhabdus sp. 5]